MLRNRLVRPLAIVLAVCALGLAGCDGVGAAAGPTPAYNPALLGFPY